MTELLFVSLHVRPGPQAVPLAAACLAACLPEAERARASLLDLFVEQSLDEMLERISSMPPRLLSLSLYNWNRRKALELCRQLKGRMPGLFIVLGGPEACARPSEVLEEFGADALVRGEGEQSFAELVGLWRKGSPEACAGVLRLAEGRLRDGGPRPVAEDFDALPSPWLTGVLAPAGGALWEISRGCPFACDFCFDARGERGVRPIGQERLKRELELFAASGVSQVWILDSTFNARPEAAKNLLRLIARVAPHIHFHLEAKAEFLDAEMARLLSRIRCSVQIGLQSLRPEVLQNVNRPFDRARFEEKLALLRKEGVSFGLDLIYGLPGDDFEGFCESLDGALRLEPNQLDIFPLALLPGTALWKKAADFGILAQEQAPYRVLRTGSSSEAAMQRCARLACAVDLFHKTGRASGVFPVLLGLFGLGPLDFCREFLAWLEASRPSVLARALGGEILSAAQALELQQGFVVHLLSRREKQALEPALRDLLNYHYSYAEAFIGPEPRPGKAPLSPQKAASRPLRRSDRLQLVEFSYSPGILLAAGVHLERFLRKNRPAKTRALIWRRDSRVFCEELDELFAELLAKSEGRLSPRQILGGRLPEAELREILAFALSEGFLVPC